MQYVARLPHLPSTRTILGLVIALVLGAGVAIGAYALIDDSNSGTQATKYIVVDQSAQGKDEAATAAAVSKEYDNGSSVELRGSKASTSSLAGTYSQTFDDGESSSPTPFGGHR